MEPYRMREQSTHPNWMYAAAWAAGIFAWLLVFPWLAWWSRGLALPILLTVAVLFVSVRPRGPWSKTEHIAFRVWVVFMLLFLVGPFVHPNIRLLLFLGGAAAWFALWPVKRDNLEVRL